MNIVPTNVNYTYSLLRKNTHDLLETFPFLNVQIIGNSVMRKNIYAFKLGNGPNKVFYFACIHANERITSVNLMKFIEDYCDAYVNNKNLYNYSIRDLFNSASIYIMPMVNPDGVDLVTGNMNYNLPAYITTRNISASFPNIPFPEGWKANIRGESFINFHFLVFKK